MGTDEIIVIFTVVLAGTTIAYTIINALMLKHLGKQLKLSRNVFLADMIIRITQRIYELYYSREKPNVPRELEDLAEKIKTVPYREGMGGAFGVIDEKLSRSFTAALESFMENYTKSHNEIIRQMKEKVRAEKEKKKVNDG